MCSSTCTVSRARPGSGGAPSRAVPVQDAGGRPILTPAKFATYVSGQPVSVSVLAGLCGLLYGSRARGDHDEASNVDVLVLSSEPGDLTMHRRVQQEMARQEGVEEALIGISSYSFAEFARMTAAGTFFVIHIPSEAILIASDSDGAAELADAQAVLGSPAVRVTARDLQTY